MLGVNASCCFSSVSLCLCGSPFGLPRYHPHAMTLTINGQPQQFDDARTVADVIRAMGLAGRPVAVELNKDVVPKRRHDATTLQDGDTLELVTLVGGG